MLGRAKRVRIEKESISRLLKKSLSLPLPS
jgi:hypothetical protein